MRTGKWDKTTRRQYIHKNIHTSHRERIGRKGLGVGDGEEEGFETGLEDTEGLRALEFLWEGEPELWSYPGEGPVPETAEVGFGGKQEAN